MEITPVQHTTKDAALRLLGVVSNKTRAKLERQVEFVQVAAGRRLLRADAFMPSVLVGVTGMVTLVDRDVTTTILEAPFVLDFWAADERRVSQFEVTAEMSTSVMLVDWSVRDVVFTAAPKLRRLSKATRLKSDAPVAVTTVEITEHQQQAKAAHLVM